MNVYKIVLDRMNNGCVTRKIHYVEEKSCLDAISAIQEIYKKMSNVVIKDFILIEMIANAVIK